MLEDVAGASPRIRKRGSIDRPEGWPNAHPTDDSACALGVIPCQPPAERLETNGLLLRPYQTADAGAVSEAIEESRPVLEKWTPEVATRRTAAEVEVGLTTLQAAWETRRKLVYGMFDRSSNRFVGEAGLYIIDWERSVGKIGVWLRTSACGRDLGHEGFTAVARHAVLELGLGTLEAHIHPANERSRRLAERVGFSLQGTVPSMPLRDGSSEEMMVFSLSGSASPWCDRPLVVQGREQLQ